MDAVLVNGRFTTSDDANPVADAVVVRGDRFAFVGPASGITDADDLPRIDLGGRVVLPGLIDAHTHPEMVTRSRWHVSLPQVETVDELLDFVRAYGVAHSKEEAPYLYFEYYPGTLFEGSAPTAALLDTAISDRPVLLQDFGDHAHWINSRMLELLGVTRETPDPVPGLEMFVRDADGDPTGHVLEMAYMHFIERMFDELVWRPPEELTADSIAPFFDFLRGRGVTALFEALVEDDAMFAAVAQLDREGRLGMHYEGSVRFRTSADLPDAIARVKRMNAEHGREHVRIRTLKLFLDGTNESGNGATIAPMLGDKHGGSRGEIQMETAELTDCFVDLSRAGIDVHIHMVGDRAFRVACDAVAAAQARLADAGEPWATQVTFAHCELVDPADIARPAELGIFVNWTPHWAGGYFGEEARGILGPERWDRMYDLTGIAASGAVLSFGSDVVSSYEEKRADPFFGMQVAATRVDPEVPIDAARYPGSVRSPESARMTVERLVRGYTIDAARQLRIDHRAGSIEVGKLANLVVLDADVFAIDVAELSTVPVAGVLFEGEVVAGSLSG